MIAVKNLSKRFGKKEVLHSVNLQLTAQVYGLLGPNGAGKTTLLRCITGLYAAQAGEILFCGEPIDHSSIFHQNLGYLPQAFGMFQELTLWEMMEYICALRNIAKSQWAAEITQALAIVNLEDKAKYRVKALSGGMVRRAGIAQVILGNPKVVLLDEPTAGLDPGERARFKIAVNEMKKDKTIIISTHIIEDIDACCQSTIVIDEGHVLFSGPCQELKTLATDKVYEVNEADRAVIAGDQFILKTFEREGGVCFRILAKEKQPGLLSAPSTLEDGYMCLVKGLA